MPKLNLIVDGKKRCSRCQENKQIVDFYHLGPKRKGKYQSHCKKCQLVVRRKYVEKHRDEINKREREKAWSKGRRPKSVPKNDWTGKRVGFIEVVGLGGERSTRGNEFVWTCRCSCGKEFLAGTSRLRRGAKSCGCRGDSARFRRRFSLEELAQRRSFGQARKAAETRSLLWEISFDRWKELIAKPCEYCGILGGNTWRITRQGEEFLFPYNGLDRVDNSVGYKESNVVPACAKCNRKKLTDTKEEFLDWSRSVFLHSVFAMPGPPGGLTWSVQ